ncbi:uncharacterized protein ACNS7B_015467 [Menidia menidia]
MHTPVFVLLLLMGSASGKKQGDFGIFTACKKNASVRLSCHYAECAGSPPYDCEFQAGNGEVLAKASNKFCEYLIEHPKQSSKNYTCILTRVKRKENRTITIDSLKPCSAATFLSQQQTPNVLQALMILTFFVTHN